MTSVNFPRLVGAALSINLALGTVLALTRPASVFRTPAGSAVVADPVAPDPVLAPPRRAAAPPAVAQRPVASVRPVRITIPRIDVAAPVIRLGVTADQALEVPGTRHETGWFTGGPAPGDVGAAVIAGHVSLARGRAVFWRLRELAVGDEVLVSRADGSLMRFVVRRVEQHPKADFPTEAVYGAVDGRELRLITCGGTFDRRTRHYLDNVIVFAELAD